jgi:acyl-CoA reductase-like NAD-dependent aldehyde dehydrogenase
VTFTGSTKTGKAIAQACSAMMKRCTLEMGGNDAAIVREDCDVDGSVDGLFVGAFMNSGQVLPCANVGFILWW